MDRKEWEERAYCSATEGGGMMQETAFTRALRTRHYPQCCTSAYCGAVDCGGCECEPILREFKSWRDRTKAKQPDQILYPTTWEATEGGE